MQSLRQKLSSWLYERKVGVQFTYPWEVADDAERRLMRARRRLLSAQPDLAAIDRERLARMEAMQVLQDLAHWRRMVAPDDHEMRQLLDRLNPATNQPMPPKIAGTSSKKGLDSSDRKV